MHCLLRCPVSLASVTTSSSENHKETTPLPELGVRREAPSLQGLFRPRLSTGDTGILGAAGTPCDGFCIIGQENKFLSNT